MSTKTFHESLGFVADPFQYTNADKETQYLGEYFISPEYFDSIWGDPSNPVPNIVYAPRGAGKSAQRIMLESRAREHNNILAISYTEHDLSSFTSIDQITIAYHLEYLNRLLLISFLSKYEDGDPFSNSFLFNYKERQFIYQLIKIYIFNTPISFPRKAISCLKTPVDYSVDFLNLIRKPITNFIKTFSKGKGLEIDLNGLKIDQSLRSSHAENFHNLLNFIKKIGYDTIYIFIDKVDEQSLTGNNVEASFKFISPLIMDLTLLETEGLSFKFFLWNKIREFSNGHFRHDRIFPYTLIWSNDQLSRMLDRRVSVYSRKKIPHFDDILINKQDKEKIILFSELSPRDCIRICKTCTAEHESHNSGNRLLDTETIDRAILKFCDEKVNELIYNEQERQKLRSLKQIIFIKDDLQKKDIVFNIHETTPLVENWSKNGIIKNFGTFRHGPEKGNVTTLQYRICDIRIAKYIFNNLNLSDFINSKTKECPICKERFVMDSYKEKFKCPICENII